MFTVAPHSATIKQEKGRKGEMEFSFLKKDDSLPPVLLFDRKEANADDVHCHAASRQDQNRRKGEKEASCLLLTVDCGVTANAAAT